jgi:DNA invertase Pin-like site-specific DNA recombinase
MELLAVIYIRQSTMVQVVRNTESTKLQYGLVDRAVALGWTADRVMTIDDDLGRSGAGGVDRPGFQRMVAEISLGHVGLVVGTDMSRLARSGRDWYQLIELCALTGALLADTDGVYDPGEYNDRLLLGLKGTVSMAELHLIKQRMQAGRVNKARRGEMAIALPIGYWRRPSGEAVLDPDEQVQTVVRLIFAKFTELGSIHGVVRYLVEHGIAVGKRLHSGPDKGQVVWIPPAKATVTCMLNSPIYAGIYAYGRRRIEPSRQKPTRHNTGLRRQDPTEWIARIEDALPAYISIQQYQANLARLAANHPHAGTPNAVRYGPALLAGLLRCGHCHRRMTVAYHVDAGKPRISYNCTGARAEYGGPICQRMSGACIDQAVTTAVLAALTPAALAVSLRAVEQSSSRAVEQSSSRADPAPNCQPHHLPTPTHTGTTRPRPRQARMVAGRPRRRTRRHHRHHPQLAPAGPTDRQAGTLRPAPLDPARQPGQVRRTPRPPRTRPRPHHPSPSPLRQHTGSQHSGAVCLTDGKPAPLGPGRNAT